MIRGERGGGAVWNTGKSREEYMSERGGGAEWWSGRLRDHICVGEKKGCRKGEIVELIVRGKHLISHLYWTVCEVFDKILFLGYRMCASKYLNSKR